MCSSQIELKKLTAKESLWAEEKWYQIESWMEMEMQEWKVSGKISM